MSHARDLRRCALQALYQFDAVPDVSADEVRASLEESSGSERTHEMGFDLAQRAWDARTDADAAVAALAPDWPTYRQPVIDRNILRLAWFEMTSGETPPKVAINEAVELAREFSTDRSPMFVNGVLDKIFRSLRTDGDALPDASADASTEAPAEAPAETQAPVATESETSEETS